jgi:hypothetical protein
LSLEEKRRDQYVAVNTLDLPAGATRQVWLEEVDFRLPLVKQVFTNENSSAGLRYLVTGDLERDYDRITTLYQRGCGVEVYHKSLKQNASLEKSPTRTPMTWRNHLFCSLCA